MFPDEDTAREWIESIIWPNGRCCGKCGSTKTREASHKTMPYWCTDCRSYFSVKTGTPLANSNIPLRKWAIGIYLCLTSLKSVSSMKLHRDLDISQKQAPLRCLGSKAYFGGHRRNMSHAKRKGLKGRGPAGKTAVAGVKDRASNQVRAKVVEKTDAETLQYFVGSNMNPFSKVYTDDASVYASLPLRHETVKHSVGEYVRGEAHTNGIESFWAMLKRAHKGTFHKISPKHLNRYVQEFAAKHNMRELDTVDQMREVVLRLMGRTLSYRRLIADNGLYSAARS